MIYKSKIACLIFIVRSIFFGVGISIIFKLSTNDAIFACLIGMGIGFIIINLFGTKKNKSFITIPYNIFIILVYLIIFETFVTSFYLVKTPSIIINIVVMSLVAYLVSKGKETIYRVSSCLSIISLITYFIIITSLIFKIDINNFTPVLINSPSNIFKAALVFTIISTTPLLYMDDALNKKELNYGYLIGSLSIIIAITITLSILGSDLITIFRYPEYMILKEITIFDFIEKIENVFAFIWGNDIIIALAINCHNLKTALPKKYRNYIFYSIIIIITYLASYTLLNDYHIKVLLYKNAGYIQGFFLLLLLVSKQLFKKRT